jgi:sec-independent protein translocase protein TatC
MSLLDHLRELRSRLLVCVYTLVPCLAAGLVWSKEAFDFLARPMNDALAATGGGTLAVVQATEGFVVQMKVAGLAGVFLASPVIAWQVWRFVAPGLYDTEKRVVVPLAMASTLLFGLGAAFCYQIIFTYGFPFFLDVNGDDVKAVLSIDSYLGMVVTMLVSFGLAFQMPVVVFFLARLGLVDARDLLRGFRYAVVAIFVVAAILTPSPDAFTQTLMAGPLLLLYGLSIVVAAVSSTKKR